MPAQQPIPSIEVSAITEDELRKPEVAKFLYKQFAEANAANNELIDDLKTERARREQVAAQLSQTDGRRQVLEAQLAALGNRNAISQLMWGAMALVLSLGIDFLKSKEWTDLCFSIGILLFLGIAVYLVNRPTRTS